MATVPNAIGLNIALSITIPNTGSASAGANQQLNSTTQNFSEATQLIATGSWQALNIGGVASSTCQYLYVRNTDSTNSVTLSTNSGGTNPFATVKAGQQCVVPYVASATYYAEATTAGCEIVVMAVDA